MLLYKYDFEKINILEYSFGGWGGGLQKAYPVYAFLNVDNCERPLMLAGLLVHRITTSMWVVFGRVKPKFAVKN